MESSNFFGGDGGLIILILFFLMMGGNGFWGNNANRGEYATSQQLYETANAQGVNAKIDSINQAINNNMFANQQNTANIMQSINTGFDMVNANINQLGFNMQQCCCDLKTQMLQDKYEDVSRQLQISVQANANAVQTSNITNTILNALGKYQPYLLTGTTTV